MDHTDHTEHMDRSSMPYHRMGRIDRPSTPYHPWLNQEELLTDQEARIRHAGQVSRFSQ